MTLTFPDNILIAAGIDEESLKTEVACCLFDRGVLALWPAAQLAGLSRVEFEAELSNRKIAIYRPTVEEVMKEVDELKRMGI